tara:strand:+ start:908 stop:1228 length:321 start_codon:yes stop_codon:yes gene_type:complete
MEKLKKNIFGKTRPIDEPIAIFRGGYFDIEVRILKIYQLPQKHHDHSRWYTVAKSDATNNSWEYGDQYAKDILKTYSFIEGEKEFEEYFLEPYHANKLYPIGWASA